jgi:hypothetical protein
MWPILATKQSLFKGGSEVFPLKQQENEMPFLGICTRFFLL